MLGDMRTTSFDHDDDSPAEAKVPRTPKPLPVYQGKGGLSAAITDPGSNRQLLDAADGVDV
jgi:hypothetical protein